MSRLIQLTENIDGESIGLYTFPDNTDDKEIKELYKDYVDSQYDSFEEYLENHSTYALNTERIFLDEIYVD